MRRFLTNRFEIQKLLRRSTSAVSFRGLDRWQGRRPVLVKYLKSGTYLPDPEFRDRLCRLHGLRHPLVSSIHDAVLTPGRDLYITRDFIEGSPVATRDQATNLALTGAVVSAVYLLRSMNLVHGRLHRENFIATPTGRVVVVDGGLPGISPKPEPRKLSFVAPEVLGGSNHDLASDLYSLGAVLYRLWSGADPFEDRDEMLLRSKCLSASPTPLSHRCVVDPELAALVDALLAKEPEPRGRAFEQLVATTPPKVPPADRAPLVGREAELDGLSAALVAPEPGLHLVVLEGAAGAGKTRILEHLRFMRSIDGGQTLIGRSFEGSPRPFGTILQALEQRFVRNDRSLEKWIASQGLHYAPSLCHLLPSATVLFEPFGRLPDPPSRGKIVADLTGALISLFSTDPSLVLVLDDAHLIDQGSVEVLEQLSWRAIETTSRIIATARVAHTLATWRTAISHLKAASTTHFRRCELTPLPGTSALELARRLGVPGTRVHWVLKRSDGNPLFIEEYSKYHAVRTCRPPKKLSDILLHEFHLYNEPQRKAAQLLSLFPTPVQQALVPTLIAMLQSDTDDCIRRLEAGGLLVRTNEHLAFRHDGIREAVYRSIRPKRRRELHRQLSDLVRATSRDWSSIAHHSHRAGNAGEALEAYCEAASQACLKDDYRRAIDLLASARTLAKRENLGVPLSATLAHAECLLAVGRRSQARDILSQAHTDPSLSAEGRANLHTLFSSSWIDTPRQCLSHSQEALHALPSGSTSIPSSLLNLARAYGMAGQVREAKEVLRRADKHFWGHAPPPAEWTAAKGLTHVALCEYREALQILESIDPPRPLAARISSNMAFCLEHLGEITQAIVFQRRALDRSREYGLLLGEVLSLSNLAAFHTKIGDLDQAEVMFGEANGFAYSAQLWRGTSGSLLPLLAADEATLRMEQGRYGIARRLIATAIRQLKSDHSSQKAIWVALKAAELYGRTHETRRAASALKRVAKSELFSSDFFTVERTLLTQTGSPAERQDQLVRCLELTHDLKTLHQRCRVLIELGAASIETKEFPRAVQFLAEARELADANGYKPLGVRIELLSGLAAVTDKERLDALTHAYRDAARIGLIELASESAFRIAETHANAGRIRSARTSLHKALTHIDDMAATLPPSAAQKYRRAPWRAEAARLNRGIERTISESESERMTKTLTKKADELFRLAYTHTVQLSRVATVADVTAIIHDALTTGLNTGGVVYLDNQGDREFDSNGRELDDTIRKAIFRLHKKGHDDLFVGERKAGMPAFAWTSLRFQHHRFGGIYAHLDKAVTERQMEFLTTVALSASTALAALLWAPGLSSPVRSTPRYGGILGRSAAIEGIGAQIEIAAQSEATVLIEGESGTGKELVARAIHENSKRSDGPFVAVDCGAIPETLIESELFGSLRGSFTGATSDRIGLIESSGGGTLFLDEIANTSPALQVKLLRVLQEREVRRLGDTKGRKVNLRLIAATNANLDTLVEECEFRQDLLYRLKVLHIRIPPLRERREDIPEMAEAFLARLNADHRTRRRFHKAALAALSRGAYRGNVRELQNTVERAYFSAVGQTLIREVVLGDVSDGNSMSDIDSWFKKLTDGRESFWRSVHGPYKARDISREKVLKLMDVGLRASKGSYKDLALMLNLKEGEYRRFMDFLRRNKCQPDFRPYRRTFGRSPDSSPPGP